MIHHLNLIFRNVMNKSLFDFICQTREFLISMNRKMMKKQIEHEDMWGPHHIMVTAAHRYCLGRRTYIVSSCVYWLMAIWSKVEPHTKNMIIRETQEAIDSGAAGDTCDVDQWNKLLKWNTESHEKCFVEDKNEI